MRIVITEEDASLKEIVEKSAAPVEVIRKFHFSGFTEEFKHNVLNSNSVLIPIILDNDTPIEGNDSGLNHDKR